jgi:hypothetical protein
MPKVSERQIVIRELDRMVRTLAMFGDDNTKDFNDLMDFMAFIESSRYLHHRVYHLGKNKSMNDTLWTFTEGDFHSL